MTNKEISAQILADIKPGTVLKHRTKNWIAPATVERITEKSVYFTDGEYENIRSLFNYAIV